MPARSSFEYAVIRVVPRVEREEFINAGVILFCLEKRYLAAKIGLNQERLKALCPDADVELIEQRLTAIPKVCAGEPEGGPIAALSVRERFHWLVAPRSTMVQVSAVHTGLCEEPSEALERLFVQFVC